MNKLATNKQKKTPSKPSKTKASTSLGSMIWIAPIVLTVFYSYYFFATKNHSFRFAGVGEIITINSGLGWDGTQYGLWAAYFPVIFSDPPETRPIDPYRAQRILPSAVVYGLTTFLKPMPYTKDPYAEAPRIIRTITTFQLYDVFLLLIACVFWLMILRAMKFVSLTQWLGFVMLFVNYAFLKYYLYYPVQTDQTAFFLSILALFFYVKRWRIGIAITAALGLFTWPTLFYTSTILFVFSYYQESPDLDKSRKPVPPIFWKSSLVLALAVLSCLCIFFTYVHFVPYPGPNPVSILTPILPLSIIALIAFMGLLLFRYLQCLPIAEIMHAFKEYSFWITTSIIIIVGLAGTWFIREYVQNSTLPALVNAEQFIGGNLTSSLSRPLVNIVAHATFFGPTFICLLALSALRLRYESRIGVGLYLLIGIGLVFVGFVTESRQIVTFLPIIALMILSSVDREFRQNNTLLKSVLMLGLAVNLISSKLWLSNNFAELAAQAEKAELYAQFPMQKIFLNHGPWINDTMYVVQGAALLVILFIFGYFFYTQQRPKKV